MTALHKGLACVCVAACLALSSGCGGQRTYPVQGKLVWADGSPAKELVGYTVTFESLEAQVGASGVVQSDGTFTVSTNNPNDGALPGKHRVALTPPEPLNIDGPRPKPAANERYHSLDTSGLEATVVKGSPTVELKVEQAEP